LEFGRESTSIAAKEAEERKAREFALAAKHEADGDERRYTIAQKRRIEALDKQADDLDVALNEHSIDKEQYDEFMAANTLSRLNITKRYQEHIRTPREDYNSRTQTSKEGIVTFIDKNGDKKLDPEYELKMNRQDAADKKVFEQAKIKQDQAKAKATAKSDYRDKRSDMYLALIKADIEPEVAKTIVDERLPIPALTQEEQLAKIYQVGREKGMSDEQIKQSVQGGESPQTEQQNTQEQSVGSQFEQNTQEQSVGSQFEQNTQEQSVGSQFEQNTQEDQEAILEWYRKRERNRHSSSSSLLTPRYGSKGKEIKFGRQNEAQFIAEYNTNEKLRTEVQAKIIREKVSRMTSEDWANAYAEYKAASAGKLLEYTSEREFKSKMRKTKNRDELRDYFRL